MLQPQKETNTYAKRKKEEAAHATQSEGRGVNRPALSLPLLSLLLSSGKSLPSLEEFRKVSGQGVMGKLFPDQNSEFISTSELDLPS